MTKHQIGRVVHLLFTTDAISSEKFSYVSCKESIFKKKKTTKNNSNTLSIFVGKHRRITWYARPLRCLGLLPNRKENIKPLYFFLPIAQEKDQSQPFSKRKTATNLLKFIKPVIAQLHVRGVTLPLLRCSIPPPQMSGEEMVFCGGGDAVSSTTEHSTKKS